MSNFHKNEGHSNLDSFPSRNFNTNTSHPLIQSSQEYMYYKKYVSIHSEDRDILKFPNPAEFEIEIPEDLLNVASLRLISWTFPANYSTFSINTSNITMTFKIHNPYNPNINNVSNVLAQKSFEYFFLSKESDFIIVIEEGFYNPSQIVTELTNKFNYAVTIRLKNYFIEKSTDPSLTTEEKAEYIKAITLLISAGGYTNFVIVYNNVSQKIWFGNTCDGFILTNETQLAKTALVENLFCGARSQTPDFSNWGLPGNIGLTRCNEESISGSSLADITKITIYNGHIVPRF